MNAGRTTAGSLYYFRHRFLDSASSRFISEDPIGFASGDANRYRYVGNDPVAATDPSGLDASRMQVHDGMHRTLKVDTTKGTVFVDFGTASGYSRLQIIGIFIVPQKGQVNIFESFRNEDKLILENTIPMSLEQGDGIVVRALELQEKAKRGELEYSLLPLFANNCLTFVNQLVAESVVRARFGNTSLPASGRNR